jgi:hypothetical protein
MKLEEAIAKAKILNDSLKELADEYEGQGSFMAAGMAVTFKLVLDTILSALRPVSKEQVEKVFPGCPYCKPDSEGYVQKFGAYSILNGELKTGHCKPQKISFCPHCSRPLTDEAVEMVMKRMEVLNDAD